MTYDDKGEVFKEIDTITESIVLLFSKYSPFGKQESFEKQPPEIREEIVHLCNDIGYKLEKIIGDLSTGVGLVASSHAWLEAESKLAVAHEILRLLLKSDPTRILPLVEEISNIELVLSRKRII